MTTKLRGLSGLFVYLGLCAALVEARQRQVTVKNSCAQQVCPGINQKDSPAQAKLTLPAEYGGGSSDFMGFCLDAGAQTILTPPSNWKSVRLWGRTGCDDKTGKCVTGDCGSDGKGHHGCTGGGIPPATLAEFTLFDGSENGQDNYDVSLVDGFNVPMSIYPSDGRCPPSYCETNINAKCPDPLRYGIDSKGNNQGCNTACTAGIAVGEWNGPQGTTAGSMNCCNGPFQTGPEVCPSMCIDYYNLWHDACPEAYAYAYDDNQGLKSCKEPGVEPDYVIEFCAGKDKDFEGNAGGVMDYAGDTADQSCPSNVTIDESQWHFVSGFNAKKEVSNGKLNGQGQSGGAPTTAAVLVLNPESTTPAAGAGAAAFSSTANNAQPSGNGADPASNGQPQPPANSIGAGAGSAQGEAPVQSPAAQQPDSNAGVGAAAGGVNPGLTVPAASAAVSSSSTQSVNQGSTTSATQPTAAGTTATPPNSGAPAAPFVPIQKQAVQPEPENGNTAAAVADTSASATGTADSQPSRETVVQQPDGSVGTTCRRSKKKRGLLGGKGGDGLRRHKARRAGTKF